jgi:acetyl-CoA carboxylase biotin carboxylase subunit
VKGAAGKGVRPLKRVLIANRGEIAVRIARACRTLGIESVLACSEADRASLAASMVDRTVCIGPAPAAQSYLDDDAVVTAALGTGCDAIHPGYGFLSERAAFRRLCDEARITFIGPCAEAIEAMGDKLTALRLAKAQGVPVIPGCDRLGSAADAKREAVAIGFPVILKATAGGGGRGMRLVRRADEVANAFVAAADGSESGFRRRHAVHGEVHRAGASRRGADSRRRARPSRAPGRARLLGAAQAPEARRGGALSGGR